MQDAAAQIQVHHTAGRTPQLLVAMQDCQEGRCGCPTDQYDRLAAIDVAVTAVEITVRLQPQPGLQRDPDELRTCLDYMLAHTEQQYPLAAEDAGVSGIPRQLGAVGLRQQGSSRPSQRTLAVT